MTVWVLQSYKINKYDQHPFFFYYYDGYDSNQCKPFTNEYELCSSLDFVFLDRRWNQKKKKEKEKSYYL
jgi:hypothetical protein